MTNVKSLTKPGWFYKPAWTIDSRYKGCFGEADLKTVFKLEDEIKDGAFQCAYAGPVIPPRLWKNDMSNPYGLAPPRKSIHLLLAEEDFINIDMQAP